jgi:hypothetical protein
LKIFIVALMVIAGTSATSLAADGKISTVQAAAAARLAKNFGTLRGAVKPDDKSVFLTIEMLEKWHPVKTDPAITGSIPRRQPAPKKTKLPPIVWETGSEIKKMFNRILSGLSGQTRQSPKPIPHHLELTLARAEKTDSTENLYFEHAHKIAMKIPLGTVRDR